MVEPPALPVDQQPMPQASIVLVGKRNTSTGVYELVPNEPFQDTGKSHATPVQANLKHVNNILNLCPTPPPRNIYQ